jgi:hypothetical protein
MLKQVSNNKAPPVLTLALPRLLELILQVKENGISLTILFIFWEFFLKLLTKLEKMKCVPT